MAALNIGDIAKSVLAAMKGVLTAAWKDVRDYAESESKKLAQTLASIVKLAASGQIDQDQAGILLDMQKHAARAVLLTIAGIGVLAAEQAVNAGLAAVAAGVNKVVGFALI